ncbi:MAG: domain containing protein [Acidobacteria bacterium]|nr:domain containing protein [Acidobacteriota bacterium]
MDRIQRAFVSRISTLIIVLVAVVAAVLLAQVSRPTPGPVIIARPPSFRVRTVLVRGYLAITVGRVLAVTGAVASRGHDVYLPGIRVYLERLSDHGKSDVVLTDLSGRFTLQAAVDQGHRVCWESPSFGDGCAQPFATGSGHKFLSTVLIGVASKDKQPTVYGKVAMDDGSLPRMLDPIANINSFARVELVDGGGNVVDKTYVNNFGEYVLAHVPGDKAFTLRAVAENARHDLQILPKSNMGALAFQAVDLTLGNTPPRLDPIVPVDAAGRRVKTGKPGGSVLLHATATDRDGDPIRYKWTVGDGSGAISATSGASIEWKLPPNEGFYRLTAVAYDGKGGYSRSLLSLRSDNRGIPFTGFVRGTDAGPISGAEVEVNGRVTLSAGPQGYFHLYVKDADRFVLNIRKRGYGFYSKIYDNAVTDGVWTLTRATVSTIDPTRDIDVVNERRPSDCPGSAAAFLDWKDFGGGPQVMWQDGKGNTLRPTKRQLAYLPLPYPRKRDDQQGCGPGIRVRIPANSIVDSAGNPPPGNVQLELSTIDLASPEQMPGDYTVETPGGTQVMESYGAGIVEIRDGAKKYNIRPGATAEVTIPVDRVQLAPGMVAPPPTIPILFYDEKRGVWTPEGTATLSGTEYKLKVPHFTPINCDTLKTNPACVRVLSPALPANYRVEVTIPLTGGAAPRIIDVPVNNAAPSEHVLYNLPINTNIVVVPYVGAAPIGTFVVNTGGAMPAGTPNLPPGPPYAACQATLTLTPQVYPDAPLSGEFLQGLYSFEATNLGELNPGVPADVTLSNALNTATGDYFHQLDPRGLRTSLPGFISRNGLGGVDEIHVSYANSGDLGFGRDMHCVRKTIVGLPDFDVACYVTNFGDNTTSDATDAFNAVHQIAPGATVAMEFSRVENALGDPQEFAPGAPRIVKFFVYQPGGAALQRAADLDGYGARPVPQLCMVCHNGEYTGGTANVSGHPVPGFTNANDVNLGARFLPFDVHFYTFDADPADAATASLLAQQPKFKQLNQEIVGFGNPGPATSELVNVKWYPGVTTTQDENALAAGWSALPRDQNLYRQVVARACRTCHVAQVFDSLQFKTTTELTDLLPAVDSRVCGQHVMPHARVTHRLFWQSISPHMPAQLDAFGNEVSPASWSIPCGAFTPATPPGAFAPVQTVINNYGCAGCHSGGAPAGGLNLNINPYSNIVNVPSTEKPSMMRIAAGAPDDSWLVHKIQGTQGTVPGPFVPPGPGVRMPQGCVGAGCVSAGDVTIVRTWVTNGANP